MRRVLKPGGVCLVVDFEPPKSGWLRMIVIESHDPHGGCGCSELCFPLMEAAGFSEIETGPTSSQASFLHPRPKHRKHNRNLTILSFSNKYRELHGISVYRNILAGAESVQRAIC